MNNDFKLLIPIDISKSVNKAGKEVMKITGVASTASVDADGESLDPDGFDLSEFNWINWNHSKDPSGYVGEVTKSQVRAKKLYIEGELYPESPMAQSIWNLAKALKNSKKNKLRLSVEGKATERDLANPLNVKKSKLFAVAICPTPKNPDTWMDIAKSDLTYDIIKSEINGNLVDAILEVITDNGEKIVVDKDFNIIKSMGTDSCTTSDNETNPIMKESIDGDLKDLQKKKKKNKKVVKNFDKSFIFNKIFNYIYDINKSKKIVALIEAIENKKENKMDNKTVEISEESISKAFETLGIPYAEVFNKGKKSEDTEDGEEEDEDKDEMEKAKQLSKEAQGAIADSSSPKDDDKDEDKEKKNIEKAKEEDKDKDDDKEDEKKPDAITKSDIETIIKSFADNNNSKTDDIVKSFGIVAKTILEKFASVNDNLSKSLNEATFQIGELTKRVNEVENTPIRKSVISAAHIEKSFIGASAPQQSVPNQKVLSISNDRSQVYNLINNKIDWNDLKKGENQFWARELSTFEVSPMLSGQAIEKLRQENVILTK